MEHEIIGFGTDGILIIASSCIKYKCVRPNGQKFPKGSSLLWSHLIVSEPTIDCKGTDYQDFENIDR